MVAVGQDDLLNDAGRRQWAGAAPQGRTLLRRRQRTDPTASSHVAGSAVSHSSQYTPAAPPARIGTWVGGVPGRLARGTTEDVVSEKYED